MSRRPARPPAVLVGLAGLAAVVVALPLAGLLARAPWSDLAAVLGAPGARRALLLSLVTSTVAAAVAVVLGVPLAWALARVEFRGRGLVRALATLPMVLPPVVAGIALLAAFGRRGIPGQWLGDAGIRIPFTPGAVVLAQVFVAMPFLVVAAEAAFRSLDPRYEDAAATLGAGPWSAFRRVALPMAAPAVAAGAVLAWARALGEFGATITFAGNVPGRTQTLPLAAFLALEQGDLDQAVALGVLLLAVSLAVLVLLRGRWLGARPRP